MKHYKLVEFLSNLDVKPPLHKCKDPRTNVKPSYWRLSGDGSVCKSESSQWWNQNTTGRFLDSSQQT